MANPSHRLWGSLKCNGKCTEMASVCDDAIHEMRRGLRPTSAICIRTRGRLANRHAGLLRSAVSPASLRGWRRRRLTPSHPYIFHHILPQNRRSPVISRATASRIGQRRSSPDSSNTSSLSMPHVADSSDGTAKSSALSSSRTTSLYFLLYLHLVLQRPSHTQ